MAKQKTLAFKKIVNKVSSVFSITVAMEMAPHQIRKISKVNTQCLPY